jgi:predicted nucleic acid-binding protein
MINGKIIDTSIWIEFLRSVKNERSILVNRLIDLNEIILLPVILQETLQGIKNDGLYQLTKESFLSYHFL